MALLQKKDDSKALDDCKWLLRQFYGKRDQLQGCVTKAMPVKSFPCTGPHRSTPGFRCLRRVRRPKWTQHFCLVDCLATAAQFHPASQSPSSSLGLSEQTTVLPRLGRSGGQDQRTHSLGCCLKGGAFGFLHKSFAFSLGILPFHCSMKGDFIF